MSKTITRFFNENAIIFSTMIFNYNRYFNLFLQVQPFLNSPVLLLQIPPNI